MTFLARILAVTLVSAMAASCGDDNTTTTSPSTSPTTMTFASHLSVAGATTRSFTTSTSGTIKVTLSSLGNGSQVAGIGIGVPATSAPCSLAMSTVTGPGSDAQIVASADAGVYCVQVYDAGRLTGDLEFSMKVEYP